MMSLRAAMRSQGSSIARIVAGRVPSPESDAGLPAVLPAGPMSGAWFPFVACRGLSAHYRAGGTTVHLIPIVLTILSALPLPLGGFFSPLVPPAAPQPAAYVTLRDEAEASYAEKTFSRAHELYQQAAALDLGAGTPRWVEFALADTAWRAAAG